MRTKDVLFLLVVGIGLGVCFTLWGQAINEEAKEAQGKIANVHWKNKHFKLNESNLMDELLAQEIAFPEIVKVQAMMETDSLRSYACIKHNNLFGFKRADGGYIQYDHWTESVAAYKDYVQHWKHPPDDYFQYLDSMGFTADKSYIKVLKQKVDKK